MESLLKERLKTNSLKPFGSGGGGCISSGNGYITDHGKIFVKKNGKKEAKVMFDGEAASCEAILETKTVRAPKPLQVIENPAGGAWFAQEYLDMRSLGKHQATLGTQLARMHKYNEEVAKGTDQYVSKFGFHATTCCGILPQDNTWEDDWVTFLANRRLEPQIKMTGDSEAWRLWEKLKPKLGKYFEGLDIKPALLHGDMWGGNVAETDDGPVLFDAAAFYGHSEYDFGIAGMFGGFERKFYDAYHAVTPKEPGWERRHELYSLFHYLNHWNHFGGGYRSQSIRLLKTLSNG